jgi:hypothetical protein
MSAAEAVLWDETCRMRCRARLPRADPGVKDDDMWRLASALKKASWVIVESRERESGLDSGGGP